MAIKWTVEEHLHLEALSLAEGDFTLIAPNLIIVESLNTLRRKVKRNEIGPEQFEQATEGLVNVFDLLVPESALAKHIAQLSTVLDHSVYDCAYLACALRYDAPLVTADVRFARKVQNSAFRNTIVELGQNTHAIVIAKLTEGVVERRALQLYQVFERTMDHVREQAATPFGHSGKMIFNTGDLRTAYDSPSYVRLKRFVTALSRTDQVRLLAVAWYGRSYVHEPWETVLAEAGEYVAFANPEPEAYIIQTFATLAAGLEKLSATLSAAPPD